MDKERKREIEQKDTELKELAKSLGITFKKAEVGSKKVEARGAQKKLLKW